MNDRYEVGYIDARSGNLELIAFRNAKTEAVSLARQYARANGQGWVGDRYAHRRRPNLWTVATAGLSVPVASKI